MELAQEAAYAWQVPKNTFKPTLPSVNSGRNRECGGGCCGIMAKGSFAVLSGDHDQCDLDIPMMMFQTEGDVPTEHALKNS